MSTSENIGNPDPELIDKKYVHKFKDENVHIYNFRRTLCHTIDADFFEKNMRFSLTEEEYNYVLSFYSRQLLASGTQAYVFKGTLASVSAKEVEQLNKQEWRYFNKCFVKTEKNKYILRQDVTEIEKQWCLLNVLKRSEHYVNDENHKKLAEILEKVEGLKKENSFIANIYANTAHPYFFEHPLDHVPGMLVLEACRQVGTAYFHIYGKVPICGIEMVLVELKAKFDSYVELNFPVKLLIRIDDIKQHKKGYWSSATEEVLVFQNGHKIAEVKIRGNCVDKKTLNRIKSRRR